ncbi:MAG: CDC48 family AAA ATPase [Nanoarchaeota archaeon]
MKEATLIVGEARHRDAGRSIARINAKDMERLDLVSGDVVEIHGKEITAAIVWPAYPEDPEGTIRIDGNIRGNAGLGIDEKVKIRKIEAKEAKEVTVAPTQVIRIVKGSEYLGSVLEGQPVAKGQNIRIDMLGNPLTFTVTDSKPAGIVIVTKTTKIVLKKAIKEGIPSIVTYEDIGGLKREIGLIREMVELPLRHPILFQKLGIDPPKGILLHGSPGTGKTLLAKAVANETDANFILVNGPEVMAKYYGESEERLRHIFEEAEANAPSIIFIDEIDSIAPSRSEMTGERQLERRVVSQLLALMDGLKSRGEVIVIAATNVPNLLDPALRRGGRFDREIEIGIPDRNSRLEILQVHTRGMPLEKDLKLKELADILHGYTGADITSLCKEAAIHALRKIIPEINIEEEIPSKILDKLVVRKDDFYESLKNIEPSALREVFIEIPKVKWSDVGGLGKAKQELIETVEWPLKYPELYEHAKVKPPKGILLHGHPGTGKTLLAKAAANESETNFISIKGPELMSKFVGESEKGIREIFRKAKQASPCILFFDELDAIAPKRGTGFGDAHVTERVISQLLTELDGVEELKDVVVLAATNRYDLIDPALLRPGRFDRIVNIAMPDEKTRLEIFKIHTKGKPLADDVDLKSLNKKEAKGFSGADIESICSKAGMLAIREFVEKSKGKKVEKNAKMFKIDIRHFKKALEEIKSRMNDEREMKEKEVATTKDGKKLMAKMSKEDMRKTGVKPGDIIEAEVAKPRKEKEKVVRKQYEKEGL